MNTGQFGTLADAIGGHDHMSSIGIEGTGFDKVYEKALSARERGEDEVECLDMEIVIGN